MKNNEYIDHASSTRHKALGFIFGISAIAYFHRVAIGVAAHAISATFLLSPSQLGYVFGAFGLAYSLFEIPCGWLGDRLGARQALPFVVLWWSLWTSLTSVSVGLLSLLAVRFMVGLGQAGVFPICARSISRWFPASEQGRAMGSCFSGIAVGAAISPPIMFFLIELQGWQRALVEIGLVGVVWSIAWYIWFRDLPEDHVSVNLLELAQIRSDQVDTESLREVRSVPWRHLLYSRNLYLICGMYFAYGYGLYFYVTWLPTYLIKAHNFSVKSTSVLSSLVWISGGVGFLLGGRASDFILKKLKSPKLARCGVGMLGYTSSAILLIFVAQASHRTHAVILISLATFCQLMTAGSAWAVCMDVGRESAGVVTGFMNTAGNLAGMIAPIIVGYIVETWGSWSIPFYITSAIFVMGTLMWALIDPGVSVLTGDRH